MKHNQFSSAGLPSSDLYNRLDTELSEFFEQLDRLGQVYLQTRTDCGGLGKVCDLATVYYDSNSHTLCAPAIGLMVPLEHLVAVHATKNDDSADSMYAFDFDFTTRPCGFSIYLVPGISNIEHYTALIEELFSKPLKRNILDCWREEFEPIKYHCDKCAKAGEMRANFPQHHPLAHIFDLLIAFKVPVVSRLVSPHADFSVTLNPVNLLIDQGIVCALDRKSSVVAMNMRYIHAMGIKEKKVDGSIYSTIEIYNSLGMQGLEFLAEGSDWVGEWTEVCQRANSSKQ